MTVVFFKKLQSIKLAIKKTQTETKSHISWRLKKTSVDSVELLPSLAEKEPIVTMPAKTIIKTGTSKNQSTLFI